MTSRVIRKDSVYCNSQVRDLLQSLFAAEFICPSSHLWLVSAWVSDIPVLDNTGMGFAAISPRWGPRKIRLSEVLVELAAQGSTVIVVTNDDLHNANFKQRLMMKANQLGVDGSVHALERDELHTKALLSDAYYLDGSMNFTQNGVEVNDETISLVLETDDVQRARIEYLDRYMPPGRD
ncbi:MAG TPA: PLD-like domain protein [Acidimicrobiaceae bacterium]|jgi:hypothetical protein|nr:PLD-like domain protein [Acidimicrobiaceae bacterium]|tara:strand:- start:219 stop:755 length:537 start_codon:yes stop_codon:yes gene_type:complete